MSQGTVESGDDITMPQDQQSLYRHQEIMRLWEEELSAYSNLEERLHELEEQLSAKDECIIEWKTAYIQCYSEQCCFREEIKRLQEENKQLQGLQVENKQLQGLQEENKQLREEIRIRSYLTEVMPIFCVIDLG